MFEPDTRRTRGPSSPSETSFGTAAGEQRVPERLAAQHRPRAPGRGRAPPGTDPRGARRRSPRGRRAPRAPPPRRASAAPRARSPGASARPGRRGAGSSRARRRAARRAGCAPTRCATTVRDEPRDPGRGARAGAVQRRLQRPQPRVVDGLALEPGEEQRRARRSSAAGRSTPPRTRATASRSERAKPHSPRSTAAKGSGPEAGGPRRGGERAPPPRARARRAGATARRAASSSPQAASGPRVHRGAHVVAEHREVLPQVEARRERGDGALAGRSASGRAGARSHAASRSSPGRVRAAQRSSKSEPVPKRSRSCAYGCAGSAKASPPASGPREAPVEPREGALVEGDGAPRAGARAEDAVVERGERDERRRAGRRATRRRGRASANASQASASAGGEDGEPGSGEEAVSPVVARERLAARGEAAGELGAGVGHGWRLPACPPGVVRKIGPRRCGSRRGPARERRSSAPSGGASTAARDRANGQGGAPIALRLSGRVERFSRTPRRPSARPGARRGGGGETRTVARARGGPRGAARGRAAAHGRARGAALRRGRDGAVDARREPREVAPRAHELVLRDLRARAGRAGRAAVPPRVRLPLQLLLRRGRAAAAAARARPPLAAAPRGRAPLPPPRWTSG